MYKREVINELNELSKEVFKSSSHWRKLIEKGEQILLTEETTVIDDKANNGEGEEKKITVPVYHHGLGGGKLLKYNLQHYTAETVKARMLEIKDQQDKFKAAVAKFQAEQAEQKAAKEAADKATVEAVVAVQDAVNAVSGSAV
jgi:hypothetical protein